MRDRGRLKLGLAAIAIAAFAAGCKEAKYHFADDLRIQFLADGPEGTEKVESIKAALGCEGDAPEEAEFLGEAAYALGLDAVRTEGGPEGDGSVILVGVEYGIEAYWLGGKKPRGCFGAPHRMEWLPRPRPNASHAGLMASAVARHSRVSRVG